MTAILLRVHSTCACLVSTSKRYCPPILMVWRRFQKWLLAAFLLLVLVGAYLLISLLLKPQPLPGAIFPSPNFDPALARKNTRPIIMISWWGRMGNHMFEYATLMGCAKRNNMKPLIPKELDLLDIFKVQIQIGSEDMLDMYYTYREEKAAGYFNKTEKLKPYNAMLSGYYQSWKYFENVKEELLTKHFAFKDEIQKKADDYINMIRTEKNKPKSQLVGIHVRRGDFVRQRLKGYTAAPLSYFYKAMNYFRRKYKDVLFIICSNDIFWAEDNLDVGPDVFYSQNSDGQVDLAVLASCRHMIITSGSYSWWAGYMVRGDVIYYKGYPQPNTKIGNLTVRDDYYPRHWIPM